MTFDESFKYCIRHEQSPSLSKIWMIAVAVEILALSACLGVLYFVLLPDTTMSAIVPLAFASGLIGWYGAMIEMATRLIKKVR